VNNFFHFAEIQMSCMVWGCSNSNLATADPSVHYYVFPKHPMIAQQWIDACGWPPDQMDPNIARICSEHFDDTSYTTEIKVIDYITCYTKVLKYDAVPTLFLPSTTPIVIKQTDPQEELREMIVFAVPTENNVAVQHVEMQEGGDNNKEYIELQVHHLSSGNDESEATRESEQNSARYKHIQTKEELSTLENCNKAIREKVMKLESNLKRLKEALAKQMETYKKKDVELSNLHLEYLRSKRSFLSLHEQKMLLSKVFSESQIKILSGKKKIYWSNDDMAVGYTIRHLSNKRCYMYLTKKLNIPLPAVSSIKRWMTLKNVKKSVALEAPKKNEDEESE
jgi:hypothetical protein